jgi:hypothetical protein
MNFEFKLSSISHAKHKSNMYNTILNSQRINMYMLQQQNALRQQNMAVVAPAPAPAHTTSTINKIPKKGFNVVLSKIKQ